MCVNVQELVILRYDIRNRSFPMVRKKNSGENYEIQYADCIFVLSTMIETLPAQFL